MMKSAISKSVSANEMRTLRESGMSNAQIAAALEITAGTVNRYIGNQPAEMSARNRAEGVKKYHERKRAAAAASNAAVEVVTRSMIDIMKDSEKKMAKEDAAKAKESAIKKASPIIKSSKTICAASALQRKRLVQHTRPAAEKKAIVKAKKCVVKPVSQLKVSDHVVYLQSESASYQYNAASNVVAVKLNNEQAFSLAMEHIPSLVSDLSAIHNSAEHRNLMQKAW